MVSQKQIKEVTNCDQLTQETVLGHTGSGRLDRRTAPVRKLSPAALLQLYLPQILLYELLQLAGRLLKVLVQINVAILLPEVVQLEQTLPTLLAADLAHDGSELRDLVHIEAPLLAATTAVISRTIGHIAIAAAAAAAQLEAVLEQLDNVNFDLGVLGHIQRLQVLNYLALFSLGQVEQQSLDSSERQIALLVLPGARWIEREKCVDFLEDFGGVDLRYEWFIALAVVRKTSDLTPDAFHDQLQVLAGGVRGLLVARLVEELDQGTVDGGLVGELEQAKCHDVDGFDELVALVIREDFRVDHDAQQIVNDVLQGLGAGVFAKVILENLVTIENS